MKERVISAGVFPFCLFQSTLIVWVIRDDPSARVRLSMPCRSTRLTGGAQCAQ